MTDPFSLWQALFFLAYAAIVGTFLIWRIIRRFR